MSDRRLKTGDVGYYRQFGEYYPARVIADDIRQCFGPVDEIVVYRVDGWRDVVARTTGGFNSFDNGAWVTSAEYAKVCARERKKELAAVKERWPDPIKAAPEQEPSAG